MQKKFLSSLLLLLFLNVLIKPLWIFGIDLSVQNRVGAEEYGLYAAIFSFTLIFNIILDLGLTHYNNQAIARKPSEIAKNFSKLTSLKAFLGLIYLVVALVLGLLLDYTKEAFYLLLILVLNQMLASFLLFLRSHLAGLHLFKTDSIMSVADKLLMIISCGVLLFTNVLKEEFTVWHFAMAQMFSYLLISIVAFIIVLKKARIFVWRLNLNEFYENLRLSFPYALLILLMALYTRVDSVMLEQISGAFENGIYAQAFRLLDAVNQLGYLFSVLLLPIFSGMFERKEDVRELVKLSFSLIFVATTAIGLAGLFSSSGIMAALYTEHSDLSAPVFGLLIISSIAFGSTYVFGTLLTARGNLRTLNMIAVGGFVLNIILNFILIPRYGAVGAASATLSTQFLTAILQLYSSLRIINISFNPGFWSRIVAFVVVSAGLTYSIHFLEWNWLMIMMVNLLSVFLISVLFRLLNLRAAIDLVASRWR